MRKTKWKGRMTWRTTRKIAAHLHRRHPSSFAAHTLRKTKDNRSKELLGRADRPSTTNNWTTHLILKLKMEEWRWMGEGKWWEGRGRWGTKMESLRGRRWRLKNEEGRRCVYVRVSRQITKLSFYLYLFTFTF